METVARLNAAGVPCEVMIAPVLPGISDSDEQLEEVVRAAVDAGATVIAPIALHLRGPLRDHYLGWLAEARPELAGRHAPALPGRLRAGARARRAERPGAGAGRQARRRAAATAAAGRGGHPIPRPRPRPTAQQLSLL